MSKIVYVYDEKTFEYLGVEECTLDPVMSKLEGRPLYASRPNSTSVAVEVPEGHTAFYDVVNKTWKCVKNDTIEVVLPKTAQQIQDKRNLERYKARIKEIEIKYNEFLNTSVEFRGYTYLPKYLDTYIALLNRQFPRVIWDSTGKEAITVTKEDLTDIVNFLDDLVEVSYQKKKEMIKKCKIDMEKLEARIDG